MITKKKNTNKSYIKAINWNDTEDRVDKAAWLRINDILWMPERIQMAHEREAFQQLPETFQVILCHSLAALGLSSSLQIATGINALKANARTDEEIAVLNSLQLIESVNNSAYSYLLKHLTTPQQADAAYAWADDDPYLSHKLHDLNQTYQSEEAFACKISNTILETALYQTHFYLPLYLFGQGHLPRTAQIIKYAMRGSSFAGIYPGYKYRKSLMTLAPEQQQKQGEKLHAFVTAMMVNEDQQIAYLYEQAPQIIPDVQHYLRYAMNKALMLLGQEARYSADLDHLNANVIRGLAQTALKDDFFDYANRHALTRFKDLGQA